METVEQTLRERHSRLPFNTLDRIQIMSLGETEERIDDITRTKVYCVSKGIFGYVWVDSSIVKDDQIDPGNCDEYWFFNYFTDHGTHEQQIIFVNDDVRRDLRGLWKFWDNSHDAKSPKDALHAVIGRGVPIDLVNVKPEHQQEFRRLLAKEKTLGKQTTNRKKKAIYEEKK